MSTETAVLAGGTTVQVGDALPSWGPIVPTTEDAVRWAAASGDFTPFHYDAHAAAERGFDGPVVHGPWKAAVLRGIAAHGLGGATIRSFSARYLHADLIGEPVTFGGTVTGIGRAADGALEVTCELTVTRSDDTVSVRATAVAAVTEQLDELPLERLRQAVRFGEVAGRFTYPVSADDIARFIQAVTGEQVDREKVVDAPPTFYAALDPVERRDIDLDGFLQDLPFPKTGGGNAFNEVTYVRPIRAGDVITVTTRYTEVYEKKGSRGTLLFRVRENELTDAAGEPVCTTRCGHVLSFDIDSQKEARR